MKQHLPVKHCQLAATIRLLCLSLMSFTLFLLSLSTCPHCDATALPTFPVGSAVVQHEARARLHADPMAQDHRSIVLFAMSERVIFLLRGFVSLTRHALIQWSVSLENESNFALQPGGSLGKGLCDATSSPVLISIGQGFCNAPSSLLSMFQCGCGMVDTMD